MTGAAQPGATGTAVGAPCAWDDCAGALEADGFCDTCGRSAPPAAPAATALPLPRPASEGPPTAAAGPQIRHGAPTAPVAGPRHGAPTDTGAMPERHAAPTVLPAGPQHGAPTVLPTMAPPGAGSGGGGGGRWSGPLATGPSGSTPLRGAGTDDIPPVPRIDPSSALLRDPQVPERDRYCRHGGTPHPVGRGRDGRPGLLRGFCPQDGTPYSFAPPLAAGTLVAGQYEVRGALAHGGLGWIYLAVDRNVDDRWVVLKGVLDANDPAALAAARAERQFLAQLSHPDIVAIHNFVRHVDDRRSRRRLHRDGLHRRVRRSRRYGARPRRRPASCRVAHALTYMIKVLPALGYLHAEGHVYCDFKPDNVMQCEQRLTLDRHGGRGADRRRRRRRLRHRRLPRARRSSAAELSPASDLYTVGRTLAVLALGIEPARGGSRDRAARRHPLLRRARVAAPAAAARHRTRTRRCRFGSADEMAEQLDGVRREVRAADERRPRPAAVRASPRRRRHVRRQACCSGTPALAGPRPPRSALAPAGRGNRSPPGDGGARSRRARPTGATDWSAALAALAARRPRHRPRRVRRHLLDVPGRARAEARAGRHRRVRRGRRRRAAVLRAGRRRRPELGRRGVRGRPHPAARGAAGRRGVARCTRCPPVPAVTSPPGARPSRPRCSATTAGVGRRRRAAGGRRRGWSGSTWTRWPPPRMRVAVLDAAVERVGGAFRRSRCWAAPGRSAPLRLEPGTEPARPGPAHPGPAERIALVDRANSAHPRTLR